MVISQLSVWFGSSPRLWGTLDHLVFLLFVHRFIPTPVGNTHYAPGDSLQRAVHPHACGEHGGIGTGMTPQLGSSPRLWGTQLRQPAGIYPRRFIPTPVGNTAAVNIPLAQSTVHPHACGEHFKRVGAALDSIGSSPRLWGTHDPIVLCNDDRRFIPTPVGNTKRGQAWRSGIAVHPHACGEHPCLPTGRRRRVGSSPRLWGTLNNPACQIVARRFIPTPVGNTPGGQSV